MYLEYALVRVGFRPRDRLSKLGNADFSTYRLRCLPFVGIPEVSPENIKNMEKPRAPLFVRVARRYAILKIEIIN